MKKVKKAILQKDKIRVYLPELDDGKHRPYISTDPALGLPKLEALLEAIKRGEVELVGNLEDLRELIEKARKSIPGPKDVIKQIEVERNAILENIWRKCCLDYTIPPHAWWINYEHNTLEFSTGWFGGDPYYKWRVEIPKDLHHLVQRYKNLTKKYYDLIDYWRWFGEYE